MKKYLVKRTFWLIASIYIVITLSFFLMHTIPGDPLVTQVNKMDEQTKLNYYSKYGLDKPVTVQYIIYLKNILKGDFGVSLVQKGRKVTDVVGQHASVSFSIGGIALVIALIVSIGIVLALVLAKSKKSVTVLSYVQILGISMPPFVIATLLQYFIAVKLKLLPITGWGDRRQMILPVVCMCILPICTYTRYMYVGLREEMKKNYVMACRAKGFRDIYILYRHVARNGMLPSLAVVGASVADMFTGSFVVESIYSIPGLGNYYLSSVSSRDYTMILGNTIFYTVVYMVSLYVVDIIYCLFDPRIMEHMK